LKEYKNQFLRIWSGLSEGIGD